MPNAYTLFTQFLHSPRHTIETMSMRHNVAAPFGGTTSCAAFGGSPTTSSGCG